MTQQHMMKHDADLNLADEKIKLTVNDLKLYYGESLALKNINLTDSGKARHCLYRPFRLR